jgi:YD repeat-containing protein
MLNAILLVVLTLALVASDAAAQSARSFYDARGNRTGSASTDSQGTTTFYDSRGNVTGRSFRDKDGGTAAADPVRPTYRPK